MNTSPHAITVRMAAPNMKCGGININATPAATPTPITDMYPKYKSFIRKYKCYSFQLRIR